MQTEYNSMMKGIINSKIPAEIHDWATKLRTLVLEKQ
jgi:hypothetical protein